MRNIITWISVVWLVTVMSHAVPATEITVKEMDQMHRWVAARFGDAGIKSAELPFSFTYGGRSSVELFKTWDLQREVTKLDRNRTRHVITCLDPKTGLTVRCVAIEYRDFPTVEWTLYLKNTGSTDTPVLENIQALDIRIERPEKTEFVLHHHTGSIAAPVDYQPHQTVLEPETDKLITPFGGRPSNGEFPYFNLEMPGDTVTVSEGKTAIWRQSRTEQKPGRGIIIVVGWPGQWAARFTRDEHNGLRVRAGQELTHFKLHPGEEVRTPLIVLQFWEADRIRAQNIWRRWMVEHNLPRPGGELPPPLWTPCSSHQFNEMLNANENNQKLFIDRYLEERLEPDYWWMDAGWYVNNGTWVNTGTWEVDTKRFPRGLRAISDHAHSKGVKIIVWFEPERVTEGSWLWQNHPEWLLTAANLPAKIAYQGQWRLLNMGNPDAWRWLMDHIDKLLIDQGIDLYRQDFNMDPLYFWRNADTKDRQGITEIRYVTGYLAYWDELRRRHPDMLIDSCASGGRRNDLETLRRAVPFLRSDYLFEETGQQCHSYGINFWIPYHGTGTLHAEPYHFWSTMAPHVTPCWDMRNKELDYELLRRLTRQWRRVSRYYYGDYYPLTPYSLNNDVWMAWQFHRSDLDEGMVQAFRRPESHTVTAELTLQGLDPEGRYRVTELDRNKSQVLTARKLMEQGLQISINNRPGTALILYKKVK